MSDDKLRSQLLDYLDDLCTDEERNEVEALLERDPGVAEKLADLRILRTALYKPTGVPAPRAELKDAVVAAAAREAAARRPRLWARYAAGFAAGVLTTMALWPAVEPSEPVIRTVHIDPAEVATPDHETFESPPDFPRRIR